MSKKIFIIEDDANIISSLQAKFSVDGFQVATETGTGTIKEIIEKINLFVPDYIILDLILPKIDGFTILNNIKTNKKLSKIPVFIFTNLSDADSKERCSDLGSEHYFIKNDFTIDEFIEKIKKIIKNKNKPR